METLFVDKAHMNQFPGEKLLSSLVELDSPLYIIRGEHKEYEIYFYPTLKEVYLKRGGIFKDLMKAKIKYDSLINLLYSWSYGRLDKKSIV